jgi:hypothetical protein
VWEHPAVPSAKELAETAREQRHEHLQASRDALVAAQAGA